MERGVCGVNFDIKNEINYFLRVGRSQGLKAATREVFSDFRSFFSERKRPESAYFQIVYTIIERNGLPVLATENGVIVRDLLDNFVAIQKTEEGRILAEEQKKQWLLVEGVVLSLSDSQEIFSFSPRGGRVEDGVALQKIHRQKDKFLVETRILPRITEGEATLLLTNLATSGRQIRNLREGNPSPLFQVVIGERNDSIDFKTETPVLINHIRNRNFPPFLRFNEPQLTLPRQVFPQTREINFPWENQRVFQQQDFLEKPVFLSSFFFIIKPANGNNSSTALVTDFTLPLMGQLREDQRDIKLFSLLLRSEEPRFLPEKREESSQVINVFSLPKISEGGVIFEAGRDERRPILGNKRGLESLEIFGNKKKEVSQKENKGKPLKSGKHIFELEKEKIKPALAGIKDLRKSEIPTTSDREIPISLTIGSDFYSRSPLNQRALIYPKVVFLKRPENLIGNFVPAPLKEDWLPKKVNLKGSNVKEFSQLIIEKRDKPLNLIPLPPELAKYKHSLKKNIPEQTFSQAILAGLKPELNKVFVGRKPQNRSLPRNTDIEPRIFQLPERSPINQGAEPIPTFLSLGRKQIRDEETAIIGTAAMIFSENEVKLKSGNYQTKLRNRDLLHLFPEFLLLFKIGKEEGLSLENRQSLIRFDWFKFFFLLSLIRGKMSETEFLERRKTSEKQPLKILRQPFFNPLPLWFEVEPEGELSKIGKVLDNKFPKKIPNSFKSLLLYLWLMRFLTQKDYLPIDSYSDRLFFALWLYLIEKERSSYCLLPEK